ncbi:hypothetical protein KKP04_13720 [Rhodomicrobium sp. Az07]|uniref:hypothetical protein n=1 Tax=Rhodomicrobium sp. Az07 TaxID=2839034 RepID=UPI001BECC42F|nr:hypothetical protein [Rhodomicrobium sp. Az07]MBT3071920.1 hypothetical protein [Rhodomicrobium sp. Az07]
MDTELQLEALLSFVMSDDRVCPRPMEWHALWQKIGGRRLDTNGGITWEPAPPIVLSAWTFSNDASRAARFYEHLQWATAHGALDIADTFVRSLPQEAWHHSNPAKPRYA